MQIKNFYFELDDVDGYYNKFCIDFTRNNQLLYFNNPDLRKPEFEALRIAFGDENVMIIYNGFSKSFMVFVFMFLFIKNEIQSIDLTKHFVETDESQRYKMTSFMYFWL